MPRPSRHCRVLAALLAIGALGGCGGDDDSASPATPRGQVVEKVKALQGATLDRDAGAFCALLTRDLRRELTRKLRLLGAKSCEDAAAKAFELIGADEVDQINESREELSTRDVRLAGRRATVTLPVLTRRVGLTRVRGDWYVSKLPTG